jgi:hypothetical protein
MEGCSPLEIILGLGTSNAQIGPSHWESYYYSLKATFFILDTSIANPKGFPPLDFDMDVSRMGNITFY